MRKTTWFAVTTIAACAILAAASLFAANMAFKLNYRLNTTTPGVSAFGRNTLSLPYFRHAGLTTAHELMLDIGGGTILPVASVSSFVELTDGFRTYTGRMGDGPGNYALTSGEGYFISMNSSRDYIVVGAHDPTLSISLDTATPGVSSTGKNFVALPYNLTARNALQVMQDIGGGSITPVANIARYNQLTNGYQVYTGRMGSPSGIFPLTTGEAYFITMNTTTPWTPSHY